MANHNKRIIRISGAGVVSLAVGDRRLEVQFVIELARLCFSLN